MTARRVLSGTGADAAVRPTPSAIARLTPLGAGDVQITGGFWAERLRTNRERTIPHGLEQLRLAGNLSNLKLAAGAHGRYRALGEASGTIFPFLDTDVYKWLEAVGWEIGRAPDRVLGDAADEVIGLVERAQRDDGYLNSYVQVVAPGREYDDLAWGHELYSFGHLIQAAIAWQRALGDDRLLRVATRAADAVDRELGPGGRDAIDGHPEVEMALVELYRATGEGRYLELAARMIDLRGHGLLGIGRFGSAYWQDHAPIRDAATVTGHAVRQLYLDCGAVDVATELGDRHLLDAVVRRWHDMMETRAYLTGGLGSRHRDEAFGDPYELPPDQAYAETCASIASVMLAWRLLLATGDPVHADAIERTTFNGVLPGLSIDGTEFFYVNALQRRTERVAEDERSGTRKPWFACACCPPNVMRFLSSWQQYLATTDAGGVQVHQFFTGEITTERAGGPIRISTATGYPWDGAVTVTILETPSEPWTLSLRVPGWRGSATLRDANGDAVTVPADARSVDETRQWQAGDTLTFELDLAVRATQPDRHVDAVRGCVAIERGPLVYCIETADLPDGVVLEDVELDPSGPMAAVARPDLPPSTIGVTAAAVVHSETGDHREIELAAVPYFTWANRTVEAMRVWIPRATEET
ncbi:MAG: glycoside hydrolase family 127 protein [Chloroflexota bacterium]